MKQINSKWDNDPETYALIRNCWLNSRRRDYISSFLKSAQSQDQVLEIGSGTGGLVHSLATLRSDLFFVGREPQASYVEFSRQQLKKTAIPNVRFEVGTAESTPLPEDGRLFQRILSNDVLHHVESIPQVFHALNRCSSTGTQWLVIEPNCRNPYVFLGQSLKKGEKNFWPTRFIQIANQSGWKLKSRNYLFLIPPFIKKPSHFLIQFEEKLEHVPLIAGGIALNLERV